MRSTLAPANIEDTIEGIQTKLAKVSINDETVPPRGPCSTTHEVEIEQDATTENVSSTAELSSLATSLESVDSSNEPSSTTSPPKYYETMVEVRICRQSAKKTMKKSQNQKDYSSVTENSTPRKKKTHTGRRSSDFVHDTKANDYVRPILNEALSPIASQSIQKFSTWAARSAKMFHVVKLAEGSYGEVYKLHLRDEASRPLVSKSKLARLRAYGDGVFKVVPLRARSGPGSRKFSAVDEIVSEAKMLKYLDPIPGFARFREIHVVQGRFPETFQSAWEHYKETKDDCWNPDPSNKKAYPDSQLWAIIEMDDAGCELEKFSWSSIFQIYDIFWGVAMALARAEEYAMFEVS